MKKLILLLLALAPCLAVSEPRFCNPDLFHEYERGNNIPYLKRVHVYQLGKLTLVGLAVGSSDYRYVQSLAEQYGVPKENGSCTWYFNEGNADAESAFNHFYVPAPYLRGPSIAKKYEAILSGIFDSNPENMLKCAREHNYIAMGCNGQKHRGPSVFAMTLAYAGCTPHHAMQIANKVWGTNFVAPSTREAIAAVGDAIGAAHPAQRSELQSLMR